MAEALATKYRPQTFSDLVGQGNIKTILENQIEAEDTKNGYCFVGGAGTGKTTAARIFARMINTVKPGSPIAHRLTEEEQKEFDDIVSEGREGGDDIMEAWSYAEIQMLTKILGEQDFTKFSIKALPLQPPYQVAPLAIIKEVTNEPSRVIGEIIEIDAASNNGVDNIRELRETCKYRPIGGGMKVYIIDEVHMLSAGAFNALLKTLEEPPAHCVFILCTTDVHKIPATILSRVQRFDFGRMTLQQTIDRLSFIIEQENNLPGNPEYVVAYDALEYVAKLAQGGMRAAISILDTCLSYRHYLELHDIFEIVGVPDYQEYIQVVQSIQAGDFITVIQLIENQHLHGKDLKRFIGGFIEFIVDLRKMQLMPQSYAEFVAAPAIYYRDMEQLVETLTNQNLVSYFKRLTDLSGRIKFESQPKTLIQGELVIL